MLPTLKEIKLIQKTESGKWSMWVKKLFNEIFERL